MAAELRLETGTEPGVWRVIGELDTHTAPQLALHLEQIDAGTHVVLDLSQMPFVSSAGLSVMLNAQRSFEQGGGSLRVTDPTASVARLIEISGVASTLGLS